VGIRLSMREIAARRAELRATGQLERDLVTAWRYGTEATGIGLLHALFRSSDRARLVASCDPLPPGAPYTLYRGVRGSGSPRGLSWTPSRSMARRRCTSATFYFFAYVGIKIWDHEELALAALGRM